MIRIQVQGFRLRVWGLGYSVEYEVSILLAGLYIQKTAPVDKILLLRRMMPKPIHPNSEASPV